MEQRLMKHIDTLLTRYSQLSVCKDDIIKAYDILEEAYSTDHKLPITGNGVTGSLASGS